MPWPPDEAEVSRLPSTTAGRSTFRPSLPDPKSGTRARPRTGTVLFVDDNPDELDLYRQHLELAGFQVEVVTNGEEALAVTSLLLPHVIVMDLMMPVIDGFEATRRLKRDPRTEHIPIIVLTGHVHDGSSAAARNAGCALQLWKPCRTDDLLKAIDSVIVPERSRH
jgi:CheY-like chemotaxis protein